MPPSVLEAYSNFCSTTITSDIDGTSDPVTFTVADTSKFPLNFITQQFRVKVGNEIMMVTDVSGSTLTAIRALENTSKVAHSSGATLKTVLTAGGLWGLLAICQQTGLYASGVNPVSFGWIGRLWLPSDHPYEYVDGITSVPYRYSLGRVNKMVLNSKQWSFLNSGMWTINTSRDHRTFSTSGSGMGISLYTRAILTAPYKVTASFLWTPPISAFASSIGIAWYSTSTGKITSFECISESGLTKFGVYKYANAMSIDTPYIDRVASPLMTGPALHMRLEDDGVNRTCSLSHDGVNFYTFYTMSSSDYMTPERFGVCMTNSSGVGGFVLSGWTEE